MLLSVHATGIDLYRSPSWCMSKAMLISIYWSTIEPCQGGNKYIDKYIQDFLISCIYQSQFLTFAVKHVFNVWRPLCILIKELFFPTFISRTVSGKPPKLQTTSRASGTIVAHWKRRKRKTTHKIVLERRSKECFSKGVVQTWRTNTENLQMYVLLKCLFVLLC